MRAFVLFAPFLLAAAFAQQSREIRVIVQGDDMGAGHGVNVATIKAYKDGILRATNLLAPAAWMPEAAQLLAQNPGLDAGVAVSTGLLDAPVLDPGFVPGDRGERRDRRGSVRDQAGEVLRVAVDVLEGDVPDGRPTHSTPSHDLSLAVRDSCSRI